MNIQNSARLSYALMTGDDSELLFELDQDSEVMRYINGGKMTSMKEIREVYVPRLESYTNFEEGWGLWKVSLTQDNRFIGWVLVRPMAFFTEKKELTNLELGWRFKRSHWGKGYATEAAKTVMDSLLKKGGISKFSAIVLEGNQASINIMQKLGMKYLKTDIHKDPLGDEEVLYYGMEIIESQ